MLALSAAVDQIVVIFVGDGTVRSRNVGDVNSLAVFHFPALLIGQRFVRVEVDTPRPATFIVDGDPNVRTERMRTERRNEREPREDPLRDAPIIGVGAAVAAAIYRKYCLLYTSDAD